MDGKPAGTITRLKPKFAKDFPTALSAHDIGLKDLIEALILSEKLPEIFLFTVSIDEIQHMVTELSPRVEATLPELFDQVKSLFVKIEEQGN
jgi:hydrogenase maturation protease